MTFLDLLRRLGILRFGAETAVYHNAKERPISLQMDHVFDSSKDLIDLNPPAEDPSTAVPKSGHDERQK